MITAFFVLAVSMAALLFIAVGIEAWTDYDTASDLVFLPIVLLILGGLAMMVCNVVLFFQS